MDKTQAILELDHFYSQNVLKEVISDFEEKIKNNQKQDIDKFLNSDAIDLSLLDASLSIKDVVGQINVIIHAWGILVSLPHILYPDEKIEYVSLGAGNSTREFDLQTTHRIAEFKFISWKGGSETIRKNNLFKDFYLLAESEQSREKYLYILGLDHAINALTSDRSLKSTLAKRSLWESFQKKYQNQYKTVGEYYIAHQHLVKIQDLREIVPRFK